MKSNRRIFLQQLSITTTGILTMPTLSSLISCSSDNAFFKISLAQWSLHRAFHNGDRDPFDFPSISKKEFEIDAVEYVNTFYFGHEQDKQYWTDLKKQCEDEGVKSLLIMCDGLGRLGDPDQAKRTEAVENHHLWVETSKFLGCHSIRVNAASEGSYEEQQKLAADGLHALCEFGAEHDINVIVENHGGLSSNGEWLSGVMEMVNHPMVGTLPDFGNFRISDEEEYDRYKGIKELMPYAKGVSAKSHVFDEEGNEKNTDFRKMLQIVKDSGYKGYIDVEYEGSELSEPDGIRATKALLEKVREEMA
jgi:L-ribulose-5-phosphate 3-epimerase